MTLTTATQTNQQTRQEAALLCLKAETTQRNRQHQDAIRLAQRAAIIMPDAPEPHTIMGRSLTTLGLHDEAIMQFNTARELSGDEQRFEAVKTLAWAHSMAGQDRKVIDCLSDMLQIDPDCRHTRLRRAITKGSNKDPKGALEDLAEVVRRHGHDADTHSLMGHAHRALAFHHLDQLNDLPTAQQHMGKALLHLEMAIEYEDARPSAFTALQQTNACRTLFGLDEF